MFPDVDDPLQRILDKVRVIPVIESPLQFFEVTIHMLDAHLIEGANN